MDSNYTFVMVDSILSLHFQKFPKEMHDTIMDASWQAALSKRPNDTLMALALTQATMSGKLITDSTIFTAYGRTGLEVTMRTENLFDDWEGEIMTIRFYDTGEYYLQYFSLDLFEDLNRFQLYKNDFFTTIVTGIP